MGNALFIFKCFLVNVSYLIFEAAIYDDTVNTFGFVNCVAIVDCLTAF